jgi:hypothetical protein
VAINQFFEIAMCNLGAFRQFEGARADFLVDINWTFAK